MTRGCADRSAIVVEPGIDTDVVGRDVGTTIDGLENPDSPMSRVRCLRCIVDSHYAGAN